MNEVKVILRCWLVALRAASDETARYFNRPSAVRLSSRSKKRGRSVYCDILQRVILEWQ